MHEVLIEYTKTIFKKKPEIFAPTNPSDLKNERDPKVDQTWQMKVLYELDL